MKDSVGKEISRRGFIARVDQDFMAANVAGTFLKKTAVNEVTTPDSPGKKLGWAIVGLGNLSILERGVGVGIAIAHDPLHGSGRAELPHPALA